MPKKHDQIQTQFFNIMLLGDTKAGKTSFCEKITKNLQPDLNDYQATLGIEPFSKNIRVDNCSVKISLYDTRGIDKAKIEGADKFEIAFESTKKEYAKKMDGFILLISPTAEEIAQNFPEGFIKRANQNLQAYRSWCEEAGVSKTIPIIVAIGKSDLILAEHRQKLKKSIDQEIIFVSALSAEGLIMQASETVANNAHTKDGQTPQASKTDTDAGLYEYFSGLVEAKVQGKSLKKIIPKKLSRRSYTGALWGLVFGAFFAVLIYNPLACIYFQISLDRWREKRLWNIFWLIAAPFLYPIGGISYQLYHQIRNGWKEGFTSEFKASFATFADRKIDDNFSIPLRALIVSLLIAALIAGAIICLLFPPAIVAPVLPTLISTVGLTGFGSWGLSIIIGSAIALALSIPFLLGDTIYRAVYPEPMPKGEPEKEPQYNGLETYSRVTQGIHISLPAGSDGAASELPIVYPPVVSSGQPPMSTLPIVEQSAVKFQNSL